MLLINNPEKLNKKKNPIDIEIKKICSPLKENKK